MADKLIVQRASRCSVERFGRIGSALLRQMEAAPGATPVLLVAELVGDAVVLGRHQRASSALAYKQVEAAGLAVHRRLGGGRAIRAGDGCIGVLLALPDPGALLPAAVGTDKVINRYVRGLLAGLTLAAGGSGVHYFGRDFISAESQQIGVVSQDGTAGGATIFEGIVGIERSLELPAALGGYPAHEDPRAAGPASTTLAELWKERHDFGDLAEKIASGYARVYGRDVELGGSVPVVGDDVTLEPQVAEDEAGWEESGVADVAIGFAEALVRHDGERVLAARIRGDFIAPAFVLRDLEASLAGCPLEFAALGAKVDAAFRQPGGMVLGMRSLRVLAEAVLAAAGKLA